MGSHTRADLAWPVPGGLLERFGLEPGEIEARSRARARELVGGRFAGVTADLAAAMVYAAGDPDLAAEVTVGPGSVEHAIEALGAGAPVLLDVAMLRAGVRLPAERRLAVAVQAPGADVLARDSGTTRTSAGVSLLWSGFGRGGVVVIGNAPTALLAVLDLARAAGPPACVIATCPGFTGAAESKQALIDSGLPHVAVRGSRGGTGVAAAALNFLLSRTGGSWLSSDGSDG